MYWNCLSNKNYSVSNLVLQYFCPSVYNWWIECWLLNVQWQILHAYSGQEQVLKYLKTIEKWGRGGISGATMFECHWKSIHYVIFNMDWQNSFFYGTYNSLSTLFSKIYKRCLTWRSQAPYKHVTWYGPQSEGNQSTGE